MVLRQRTVSEVMRVEVVTLGPDETLDPRTFLRSVEVREVMAKDVVTVEPEASRDGSPHRGLPWGRGIRKRESKRGARST